MQEDRVGPKVVWTSGYAGLEYDLWTEVLRARQVQIVADVRSLPYSRPFPKFSRTHLAHDLPRRGLTYYHLTELGGPSRPGSGFEGGGAHTAATAYIRHLHSENFQQGLLRLLALITLGPVALLCLETDWRRCHRRFLADVLTVRGLQVMHLDPAGQARPHALTPGLVVCGQELRYPDQPEQTRLW